MLALHLPPLYSCPSSTHTRERERERERERSREREEEGDTEKERKLSERATHTLTTERKQAFCASSLLACTHTQNYARRAGRSAGSRACPLSLSTHTCRWRHISPPRACRHANTCMSAVRDPALAHIPRRYLYLNDNKLDHLPETIFRNLTSLR